MGGAAAKDIDEQKKNEKSLKAGVADPTKHLQGRMLFFELLADIQRKKEEGDSQAKMSKLPVRRNECSSLNCREMVGKLPDSSRIARSSCKVASP